MRTSLFEALFTATCWVAAPLMAIAALWCLLSCHGRKHLRLVWVAGIFAGSAALLGGGGLLLRQLGLAWRNGPAATLALAFLVSGLAVTILTVDCLIPLEMPDVAPILRRTIKGTALVCAMLILFYAVTMGAIFGMFVFGGDERVLDYEGQKLVEVDDSFLDPVYNYYEYHGPLLRGAQQIYGHQLTTLDGHG